MASIARFRFTGTAGERNSYMNELWATILGILFGDFLRYLLGAGLVFLVLWKLLRKLGSPWGNAAK